MKPERKGTMKIIVLPKSISKESDAHNVFEILRKNSEIGLIELKSQSGLSNKSGIKPLNYSQKRIWLKFSKQKKDYL